MKKQKANIFVVFVTHMHGDHAHYDIKLDTPTEQDEIVKTDKDIEVLVRQTVMNF